MLQAKKIDANIKDFNEIKALDFYKANAPTLKLLLQIGNLSAEKANEHVTQLLDRGNDLQEKNDLNSAISNYKVADLLLREFSAVTD